MAGIGPRDAVIVDALRTPVGKLRGALASVRPDDLAAAVVAEAVARASNAPDSAWVRVSKRNQGQTTFFAENVVCPCFFRRPAFFFARP